MSTNRYLTGRGGFESENVSQSWDNIDSEANKKRSDGGVDWSKERENDGQKPNGNDNRQSSCGTLAQALAFVQAYCLFPHEIQRGAGKPKCNELHKTSSFVKKPINSNSSIDDGR